MNELDKQKIIDEVTDRLDKIQPPNIWRQVGKREYIYIGVQEGQRSRRGDEQE